MFEITLFLLGQYQNIQKCSWAISQIAVPNMWFLVLIDLANRLCDIEKFLISFYAICYYKLSCFIKTFFKQTWWKFNGLYVNICLSSSNIFEENQFHEIKKKNVTQLICD